jgi:hypothetical protein
MRNCTRDEGGPFGFGNQVLISSHCKLLLSKATVVSVAKRWDRIPAGTVERVAEKPSDRSSSPRIAISQRGIKHMHGITLQTPRKRTFSAAC